MALFEKGLEEKDNEFPTLPAFLVRVEVKDIPSMGNGGHKGIFTLEKLPAQTKIWKWTKRIQVIPQLELQTYIQNNYDIEKELDAIRIFLRQGFVLPSSKEHPNGDQYFNSNPSDAGRFMNHSNTPNCGPDGALRDIEVGEELTMNYNFHGNPQWYVDICEKYGVLTERQVAERFS